ncbi:MAG: hypothetical protein HZB44_07540 [Actinobacteria bacterium]|nr:hypothetical protein [Actinomycetota bacterium]
MDFSELTLGEKIVGGGAIALLISLFLPWYAWSSGATIIGSYSANVSLMSGYGGIAFLILAACVVAVGAILLRMLNIFDIGDQGVPEATVVLGAAAIAGLLVIWKFLTMPSYGGLSLDGAGYGRSYGAYIAIVAAVALVAGAVMKFQEER